MKIERVWAMPNGATFKIKPIAALLREYVGDGEGWFDPFAGFNSPAKITNDLCPEAPTKFHVDALTLIMEMKETFQGILYDPPYSFRQAKELYGSNGSEFFSPTSMGYWAACKRELVRLLAPQGIVICCGWNTNGIGKRRGFTMERCLIVHHGGSKNDTLVTVERKTHHQELLPLESQKGEG